jgi:hypothetical protein
MTEKEEKPTIEQLAEQLRKATELSKTLPQPYQSFHRELNDLYGRIKVALRKRPGSSGKIGGE